MTDKLIAVRVACRIRPLSNKEEEEGCQVGVQLVPGRPQVYLSTLDKAFTYDYAFGERSTQGEVYDKAVSGMINQLFEGFNVTVMAYGQTGSGKTYTMGTTFDQDDTPPDAAGIIPRAVGEIFDKIKSKQDEMEVGVEVSFVELYREQLYDLLSNKSKKKEDCVCVLREDPLKGVIIPNLTENKVSSVRETMSQLQLGSLKRVTAATAMNHVSSRSHAIFSLYLTMTSKVEDGPSTLAKFHFVDLAGSERNDKTKAAGVRQKEGIAINEGLLALSNVIAALGEESNGKQTYIPYRNSKLTRLLQDSLGGNSHTLMISCVSPADSNLDETMSTLRYSDRARQIKNKPVVNLGGSDMELNRLRLENQELRMQLRQAGGGIGSMDTASREELEALQATNKKLREENKELGTALMSCNEELAHLNEKVVLQENFGDKVKTQLKELLAETAAQCQTNENLRELHRKAMNLIELQSEAEKTIMDHDLTRGNSSTISDDSDCHEDTFATEHVLKSKELTNQLLNLNKMLAQKEKLASRMAENDEQLQKMKLTYEKTLVNLESEVQMLMKEKQELLQQQKNASHDPKSKIAEQRRKRIQELEEKLKELNRKVMEQQRAIKMNEKNAAQVKKLNEEILQLKQNKVKLIHQFKEDAEKLRVYKQQKEKEVMQLKQAERKHQVKVAKMESLHAKKENFYRRKMEEANLVNKRLKEVMEKQKHSKFRMDKGGLAGAGERVRNWLNEELDMVISVKEAMLSRDQLLNDRKALTKELNDLKKNARNTMNMDQMEEHEKRVNNLQEELDIRNAQLSQLHKQIADLEENNSKARFDQVKSMAEAKIALEHAFEKSVEQTLLGSQIKSEFEELKNMYDEAVKNTNALEKEIANLKDEYETQAIRIRGDHEEKVLFLLSKLSNSTEGERNRIHDEEIRKYTKLNEVLMKMSEENEKLKQDAKLATVVKKPKRAERYTEQEFFEQNNESEVESDDEEQMSDDDPDWVKTPLYKRIKKIRESTMIISNKRRLDPNDETIPAKRISGNSSLNGCKCKTGCGNNRCQCKKNGPACTDSCGCDPEVCKNRSCNNQSNNESSPNDTANTMSLLNETYTSSLLTGTSSPKRKRSESEEDDDESLPALKVPLRDRTQTIFKSPILEEKDKRKSFTSPAKPMRL